MYLYDDYLKDLYRILDSYSGLVSVVAVIEKAGSEIVSINKNNTKILCI